MKIIIFMMVLLSLAMCTDSFELDSQDAELIIKVEDNLGGVLGDVWDEDVWSQRSVILVKSVRNGLANIKHIRSWTQELDNNLQKVSAERGFYKLRFTQAGSKDTQESLTFVDSELPLPPYCAETLTLVVSPTLRLLSAHSATHSHTSPTEGFPAQYNTTVVVRSPASPLVPDTASHVQKIEMMQKEKVENKDNRSFFAKYWMYIVPVVLLLVLSGGAEK